MSTLGDPCEGSRIPPLPSVRCQLESGCLVTLCCDGAARRTTVAPATAEEAWWPQRGNWVPSPAGSVPGTGGLRLHVCIPIPEWYVVGRRNQRVGRRECCLWVNIPGWAQLCKEKFCGLGDLCADLSKAGLGPGRPAPLDLDDLSF